MATLQAVTVTNSKATVTDPAAIKNIVADYELAVEAKLTDDDQLKILGSADFNPYPIIDGEVFNKPAPREFLYRIAPYIADGECLDIRIAGFTKLRHVLAARWAVYPGIVIHSDLTTAPRIVGPPDTLRECLDAGELKIIDDSIKRIAAKDTNALEATIQDLTAPDQEQFPAEA